MIVLAGADLVLPDRVLQAGTLRIDNGRIAEVRSDSQSATTFAFHGHTIVPGFIDVHVHGTGGVDTLDEGDAVAAVAAMLPRYGVTAFCPTTVACAPAALERLLEQVGRCREQPSPHSARVLPAHLESNFINPEYRGAQPLHCLRTCVPGTGAAAATASDSFTAADIVRLIEARTPDVGIVTLAPEIPGGLELVARLAARGIRVSLGHSGADCDTALAAIAAGATQATHLFNRMPALHHRAPGLAGAVLQSDEVAAELVCDGVHVHPVMARMAIAAKTAARIMAVTDGTAATGLPAGGRSRLGGVPITAAADHAVLDDGTLAGSVLTMDGAYRRLTATMGCSPVEAAAMCATTPARQLGLHGHGVIVEGAVADLVVLDRAGAVVQTYVGGTLVFARAVTPGNSV